MRDDSDISSITEAAERAGVAGDWPTAERLLRKAVTAQEAALGRTHPDLAYTLNNLGVACERIGNANDAETCYRRAYAVATAALPATDPLVVACGQNLREFCEASGIPFDDTSPLLALPSEKGQPDTSPLRALTSEEREPEARDVDTAVQDAIAPVEPARRVIAGATAAVVLIVVIVAAAMWLRAGPESPARSDTQGEPVAAPAAPAAGPPAAPVPAPTPAPALPEPTTTIDKGSVDTRAPIDVEPPVPRAPIPASASEVSVVTAQLCRALSNWQCTPATSPTDATQLFFYTRVRSPVDTMVEHRWYYEGKLLRTVPLRIGANVGPGYRTFSRNTISAERQGAWRVEVRTQDGTVLHEELVEVQR